jgi:hypothetical protein
MHSSLDEHLYEINYIWQLQQKRHVLLRAKKVGHQISVSFVNSM